MKVVIESRESPEASTVKDCPAERFEKSPNVFPLLSKAMIVGLLG
jgi:hypothetical protein